MPYTSQKPSYLITVSSFTNWHIFPRCSKCAVSLFLNVPAYMWDLHYYVKMTVASRSLGFSFLLKYPPCSPVWNPALPSVSFPKRKPIA